jgi:hypothetical protein
MRACVNQAQASHIQLRSNVNKRMCSGTTDTSASTAQHLNGM